MREQRATTHDSPYISRAHFYPPPSSLLSLTPVAKLPMGIGLEIEINWFHVIRMHIHLSQWCHQIRQFLPLRYSSRADGGCNDLVIDMVEFQVHVYDSSTDIAGMDGVG